MADQRGASLTSLTAAILPAVLVLAGLVIDGGARAAAQRRAEVAAAAAARAAVESTATARLAGQPYQVGQAVQAARTTLAEYGVAGEVRIDQGVARVETSTSTTTVFLSLIGVNLLTAQGYAEAELVSG